MGKQPPWAILSKMGEDNDWEPCLAKDVLCIFCGVGWGFFEFLQLSLEGSCLIEFPWPSLPVKTTSISFCKERISNENMDSTVDLNTCGVGGPADLKQL